jgi:hypothetical protein
MVTDVRQPVEAFLAQVDSVLGPRYSAVLYGSASRGDWHPARSDINLLLVADDLRPGDLRGLGGALAGLPESWRTPPLLFTRQEWHDGADVFPVEVADMLLSHEVLRGSDPLEGRRVDPSHLRAALEREFRTKVIRLRQGYALRAGDPAALGEFATATLATVLVLARTTLVLLGRPVPQTPVLVLQAFAEAAGTPAAPLAAVAGHRNDLVWRCEPDLFESYLEAIAAAAALLNTSRPGAV